GTPHPVTWKKATTINKTHICTTNTESSIAIPKPSVAQTPQGRGSTLLAEGSGGGISGAICGGGNVSTDKTGGSSDGALVPRRSARVTSAMLGRTRSAACSRFAGNVWATATQRMPADLAACTPFTASSTTVHSLGVSPRRLAAARNKSGAGFFKTASSAEITASQS